MNKTPISQIKNYSPVRRRVVFFVFIPSTLLCGMRGIWGIQQNGLLYLQDIHCDRFFSLCSAQTVLDQQWKDIGDFLEIDKLKIVNLDSSDCMRNISVPDQKDLTSLGWSISPTLMLTTRVCCWWSEAASATQMSPATIKKSGIFLVDRIRKRVKRRGEKNTVHKGSLSDNIVFLDNRHEEWPELEEFIFGEKIFLYRKDYPVWFLLTNLDERTTEVWPTSRFIHLLPSRGLSPPEDLVYE